VVGAVGSLHPLGVVVGIQVIDIDARGKGRNRLPEGTRPTDILLSRGRRSIMAFQTVRAAS